METGEIIYVHTPNLEGLATIMHIEPGDIWPVQVELQNPDDDGHRIYRVAYAEIKPIQDKRRYVARVTRHMRGYNIGDVFVISRPGPNGYYSVWDAERAHKAPIGSYITDFFEIIEPFAEAKKAMPLKTAQMPQIKAMPIPAPMPLPEVAPPKIEAKPKARKGKKEIEGQLSIFDFM